MGAEDYVVPTSTFRGSGRSSSMLVDVEGPGLNKFWIKTCADSDSRVLDSTVSAAYPDLFNGKAATSIISGGMENSFYISDFPLASKPPYGDAKIDGANFFFYITDVDRTEVGAQGHIPHYSFYMVDNAIGSGNEGNITPYPTGQFPDSPLAAFSSNFTDEGYWSLEDFSQGEEAKVVNGTVMIKTDPYLPLQWALDNTTDGLIFNASDSSMFGPQYWENKDGVVNELPNGEKVVFVEKVGSNWGPGSGWLSFNDQWVPVNGRGWMRNDPEWQSSTLKGSGYPKYAYTMESTYTLNAPVSTENSFFDAVKRLKTTTLYDDTGALQHGSEIVFNAEDSLTGGSAMMMNSRWDETKSGSLGWDAMVGSGLSYANHKDGAYGENSGRTMKTHWNSSGSGTFTSSDTTLVWLPHRQRGVVVKKIPSPIIYAPRKGMDWTGQHGKIHRKTSPIDTPLEDTYPDTGDVNDRNVTTSEIDFTMKVEELSPAPYYVDAGSTWNNPSEDGLEFMSMDTRSICVMLGTRPPRDAESFFDYFYNTSCSENGWNDKGTKAVAGSPGHAGDRDGLSTGFVIVRPPYMDYKIDDEGAIDDGTLVTARGSKGPGNNYDNGAERWKGSGIGRNFMKDGLICLPLAGRYNPSNYVNGGSSGVDGVLANKTRWSVWGGVKGSDKWGKDHFGGGGRGDKDSDYNSTSYLMNVRARFDQEDLEYYAIPVPDKEWLRVRIFLNGDETDKIYFQLENASDGSILGRSYFTYSENSTIWGAGQDPTYLSIWCNNHPGTVATDENGNERRRFWGESRATRFSTQTKLFVDEIKFKKFNMTHNNASIDNANTSKSTLKIQRNVVTNAYMQKTITPSYLSFGFENSSDLMDGATYLFFNGISGNTTTPDSIGNNYIRGTASMSGWTVDGIDGESLGGSWFDAKIAATGTDDYTDSSLTQARSPFFHLADSALDNIQIAARGLSINGSESGGVGAFWDGTRRSGGIAAGTQHITMTGNETDTENFSYKGLMKFNHASGQLCEVPVGSGSNKHYIMNYDIAARENDYVAARVTDIDITTGEITVDDPNIFQLKEGIQYRLYFRGGLKKANSNNFRIESTYQDVYLASDTITNNVITIKSELNRWFIDGWRNGVKVTDNLWISPKLHWLILETLPYNSDNEKIEDRTYRSVVEVNRGNSSFPTSTDYGVTYNERTYNDGINQNAWDLDFTIDNSAVETTTDFGFGSLTAEGVGGGELGKIKIRDTNLWHSVDLSGAITEGNKEEGDILTTLIAPGALSSFIKTTMNTTDSITKTTEDNEWYLHGGAHFEGVFRPFLLTRFHDELPVIEDFNISPAEGREFFPKFTWNCKDDDIWYGFIMVDDKQIHHQYQNAVLHMPLNTPKKSNVAHNVNVGKNNITVPDWYSWANDINSITWAKKLGSATPYAYPLYYVLEDRELAFDPEGLSGWCHRFTQPNKAESVNALNLFSTNSDVDIFGFGGTCPQKEMSLILHVIPDYKSPPTNFNQMLFDNGGGVVYGNVTSTTVPDKLRFFKVYIDTNGYIKVEICPTNCQENTYTETGGAIIYSPVAGTPNKVVLSSQSIIPMDGITPTNIIVTLDAGLRKNNVKLFINGNLEDTTGKSYTDMELASSNRWPFDTKMATNSETSMITVGNLRSARKVNSQPQAYHGRMEEVVYYNKCIYPVNVDSGEYILEKPLKELNANNQSKPYNARLFVKDYHNIRGTTTDKVASSPSVAWRKSVPLFTEASD